MTVETGFHLCENGSEFFEGELRAGNNTFQMELHTLDSCFPETAEVRSTLWNKFPLDILCRTEL